MAGSRNSLAPSIRAAAAAPLSVQLSRIDEILSAGDPMAIISAMSPSIKLEDSPWPCTNCVAVNERCLPITGNLCFMCAFTGKKRTCDLSYFTIVTNKKIAETNLHNSALLHCFAKGHTDEASDSASAMSELSSTGSTDSDSDISEPDQDRPRKRIKCEHANSDGDDSDATQSSDEDVDDDSNPSDVNTIERIKELEESLVNSIEERKAQVTRLKKELYVIRRVKRDLEGI